MVTGQVPYEAETPLAVVFMHVNDPPPLPRYVRPDLPEAVERVILKAMAKTPAERWPTPREMVEALNQAVASLPGGAGAVETAVPGLASTAIKAQAAERAEASEDLLPGIQAVSGPAQPRATAPRASEGPAELGAPPARAKPPQAARRLPRWLPVAGGATLLLAVIAVAVLVFGQRGSEGRRASATQPATAAASPTPVMPAAGTSGPAGWTNYSNANLALAVALQGELLWVGSDGGLVRWDLSDGSHVKLGIADGLASGRINDLLVDGEGVLWVATSSGLCRLDGGTWTTFDQADGLDSNWVEVLWEDAEGSVWAGTVYGSRGLNYSGGGRWGPPPIPALPVGAPAITSLAGDDSADLYVGMADAGVAHFDGQEWTVLGSKDGLPGDRVVALAVAEAALWASFDDALVRFDRASGGWEKVRDTTVYAIHAASDGAAWFGTADGAIRLDPATGDWQPFESAAGTFPSRRPVTGISESAGTIWFATYGDGSISYDGRDWKTWMTDDLLGGNLIEAIQLGRDGSLWFTHPGTGLSRYEPDRDAWQAFGEADGALDWPSAPGMDDQGLVWIARDGTMLSYDGQGWQALAVPELENVGVQAIDIGPGSVRWLRTDAGLMRNDPATGTWTTFGSADHPILGNVYALLLARDGTVWAGGQEGLVRYDGSAWSAGETSTAELRDVKDIAQAADDSLWLAADGSLIHLADGKQYAYHRPDDSYLDRLAIAPDGSVWTGYEGVGRFDPGTNRWQLFSTADGLIDTRVTDILVTPDGAVWIATESGVSRFVPPGP